MLFTKQLYNHYIRKNCRSYEIRKTYSPWINPRKVYGKNRKKTEKSEE
jgi:hypothetical protein